MTPSGTIPCLDLGRGVAPMALDAAGLASGGAFLEGELELRRPRLNEPLAAVTWPRDITAITGGGYVEFTSNFFVDYATAGANQFGIVGGQTNTIPIIQANLSKDIFPVLPFANIIRVPFLDDQKMKQMGRSLDQIYDTGLRLNYQKSLDQNVYLGYSDFGTTGLVNNPNVTSGVAPTVSSNVKWFTFDVNGAPTQVKTAQQILTDLNSGIYTTWKNSQFDLEGMANQLLLPPAVVSALITTIITVSGYPGGVSIMKFLEDNNLAKAQGRPFKIVPCRQCIGQGVPLTTGGANTDRAVFYVNDEFKVNFDLPEPLKRVMTQPVVTDAAFLSLYLGLIGVTKFLYLQCVYYMDGISSGDTQP